MSSISESNLPRRESLRFPRTRLLRRFSSICVAGVATVRGVVRVDSGGAWSIADKGVRTDL